MFCDHFVSFKTAAKYVCYVSESILNWEKYSKQRRKDKLPLAKILDKMNLDITAGTTVDDHDLYNAPMLVRKPNTLKRFHK